MRQRLRSIAAALSPAAMALVAGGAAAQGIVRAPEPEAVAPGAARLPIHYVPTRHGPAFATPRGIEVGGRVVVRADGNGAAGPEIVAVLMVGGRPGLLLLQLPDAEGCPARHAVLDVAGPAPPALSEPVPTCTPEVAVRSLGATVTLTAAALPGGRSLRVWVIEGGRIRRG